MFSAVDSVKERVGVPFLATRRTGRALGAGTAKEAEWEQLAGQTAQGCSEKIKRASSSDFLHEKSSVEAEVSAWRGEPEGL